MGNGHALVIEDEAIAALDLQAQLYDLGFLSVDVAASQAEALARAREHRPDLITADYRIIDGTGVQATAAITAELGRIPIIYVTGNAAQVRGQGVPVVEKPYWPSVLRDACATALDGPPRRGNRRGGDEGLSGASA